MDKVKFSSAKTDWATPNWLFDYLENIFHFDLDAAADSTNKKCEKWLGPGSSISEDALAVPWKGKVWINPPYTRDMASWIGHAVESTKKKKDATTIVMLVAARTETKFFDLIWRHASAICFIHGRIKFDGGNSCATFPSAIAVFGKITDKQRSKLAYLGNVVRVLHRFGD